MSWQANPAICDLDSQSASACDTLPWLIHASMGWRQLQSQADSAPPPAAILGVPALSTRIMHGTRCLREIAVSFTGSIPREIVSQYVAALGGMYLHQLANHLQHSAHMLHRRTKLTPRGPFLQSCLLAQTSGPFHCAHHRHCFESQQSRLCLPRCPFTIRMLTRHGTDWLPKFGPLITPLSRRRIVNVSRICRMHAGHAIESWRS